MRNIWFIFKRELGGYFATPVAYVFLVIFLVLASTFTFYLGNFFERGQADLQAFFSFHPWLYLFLIPALAMRLWSEERRAGTIELFLTLPISIGEAVTAKFLAAWAFVAIALALTFPIWITVNLLGQPDNGIILASYVGSLLMSAGYLAIGACISALTKSQVVAFVVAAAACFVFTVSGTSLVLAFFAGWAPSGMVETIAGFSFLTHFNAITRGVIDLRDIVYFASLVAAFLFANAAIVEMKKAG
ncbi:MAG: ABC transporter permease subunit [Proteobacteria bacterium]|nr:ABC transporter permease subunit [Pseudomonadota bacterium]